ARRTQPGPPLRGGRPSRARSATNAADGAPAPRSIRPPRRTILPRARLYRRDARELFEGGETGDDLLDAVGPEGRHPSVERRALEFFVARPARGEGRQLFVHCQELDKARAAAVAGLPAADAPVSAEELDLAMHELLRDARRVQLLLARHVELLAVLAEPTRKTLRQYARHGGAGKERLDAHLVQTRER